MYAEEEVKRGTPIRDFLLKLILVIIFVLLLLWLLPARINSTLQSNNGGNGNGNGSSTTSGGNVDLTAITNRIFNANIQEMKEAGILYYTTERLPKNVGDESKLTLKEMVKQFTKVIISLYTPNNNV